MRVRRLNPIVIFTVILVFMTCGQASAQSLPTGWSHRDVGAVGVAGNASYANGVFTVSGAGPNIYGTADGFHFVYQPMAGDGSIVARVLSVQGMRSGTTPKVGVMIRETLTPNSTQVSSVYCTTPLVEFLWRSQVGTSTSFTNSGSTPLPYWVKVVRSNGTFTAYNSPDGSNWTQVGTGSTFGMGTNVYIGLAVSSSDSNNNSLVTATLDNVSVSATQWAPPSAPWLDQDVGTVGIPGSAGYANGVFTVAGAGTQIYGTADGMNFAYQPLSGNGTIVARLLNVQGMQSGVSAKAGVMIRETLNANSTHGSAIYLTGNPLVNFLWRPTTGASTSFANCTPQPMPSWVKMVRSGNTFSAYCSPDGVTWTQVGSSQTISMATNVYIGLAVSSVNSNNNRLVTATFDNVSVSSSTASLSVISSIWPATGIAGFDVLISGSGFGASQGNSQVLLNGTPMTVSSWSSTSINVTVPPGATSGPLAVLVGPSMNASNPVTFKVLTDPMLDQDVGTVAAHGNASYANGVFTVSGAGANIYGTADGMHFAYQPLSGDGTIVARVVSITGMQNATAKAGVMIRETLNANSTHASAVFLTGNPLVNFLWRPTTGASTSFADCTPQPLPYWLKVVRSGNTFSAYCSANGTTWTQVGSNQTFSMATNAYIGLAVSSGSTNNYLVTATFDNVSITSTAAQPPVIGDINPFAGGVGSLVTIMGANLGASGGTNSVTFNGTSATPTFWNSTGIVVPVPAGATSGNVIVHANGMNSNAVPFTVLPTPNITSISPTSGPVGTPVTINGSGFGATQGNSIVSFDGVVATTFTSWSDGQIVAVVPAAASGPVTVQGATIAWGPLFTATTTSQLTDSLGNISTYTSSLIGGIWVPTTTQGSGCSSCTDRGNITSTFDAQGHLLSRTDELGHTTTYTYDGSGNVLSVTQPAVGGTNPTTVYTYNSFGEVLTATDPLGFVTTNTYDANGNLKTVTMPAPNGTTAASVTQFTYDPKGQLTQITDPLNHVTTLAYYPTGLINTITDAQNNVTTYTYDTHGNRTSVKDANNQTTTFAYDTGDRLKTITYPGSTGTTTLGYDYRGRRTSVTDQNGKTTIYAYDDADRLLTVTDAATPGNVTTYAYDTENNLTSIKDANNHTTSFNYDAFGRVSKTNFPSTLSEFYYYDAVGNLTSKIDRNNHTITYSYDPLNRLSQKLYPDTTAVNYTYDNDSRLTQVADPTGTYQFTFDNMGRLTNTTTSYAFLAGRNFTTGYGYDAASNRTGFTDPESGATSYLYDTLNRLQTLTPPAAFSGTGNFGFTYDALSRRTQMTRPNGLKSVYAYDNLSRLQSVLHQSGASTTVDGAAYVVDNAGNRTSRTPQPSGTASNYTYDNIYELTGVTQGSTTTESYTYDPVGNRLSSLGVSSYTNNSSNELTSTSNATYTYDNNGNTQTKVVGSNTTSYAWDFENRMSSVTLPGTGGTVSFKYDPFGRRIYKSSSSGTSIFAYDGDNLVEETNATGGVVARYEQTQNIDEPLAMLRSSATSYFHADGLGSVTSLSNAAGSIANTYTYDSFGKLTASTGSLVNSFQYTARESDTESGLYYYRARYYDQSTGRFLSEDPLRFFAGIDFYPYARSSPTRFIDPKGTDIREIYNDIYNVGLAFAINARILADVSLSGAEQWVRDQGLPASALHNGAGDAFRHCLWSCLMARNIGARNAALIADEHENAGRREGQPSDEEAMDRANNVAGRICAAKSPKPCREACTDAYHNGFLFGLGGVRNYFPSN